MGTVNITAVLNPVSRERAFCEIPAEGRLSDHIDVPDEVIVQRNGRGYRDGLLKDGDIINMVVPPAGGEQGKRAITSVALLAVQVAAFTLSGGITGITAVGQSLITAGVTAAASFGANPMGNLNRTGIPCRQ